MCKRGYSFSNRESMMNPECEQFPGRLCDLCNGTALDPDGKPMDLKIINGWRNRQGLLPLGHPQQPSLLKQAKSFAKSMGKAAMNKVTTGKALVDQEVTQERLAICKGCEFYTGVKCRACGCRCNGSTSLMNKLALAHEACPKKKWGPVST